jgi:hypothetical protein
VVHTEDAPPIPLDLPVATENVPDPIAAGSPEAVHETSAPHAAPSPEKSGT